MARNVYQLSVRRGPEAGQSFPLTKDSVTVGRDPMADIVLSDPEVSRQHARLTRDDEGFEIQDLGSTNGTFVDGKRLSGEPVRVPPGAVITMGSNVTLVLEPPAEPTATVISPEGVEFPEAELPEEEEPEGEIAKVAEPLPPDPEGEVEAEIMQAAEPLPPPSEEEEPEPEAFEEPAGIGDDEATSVEFPAAGAPESPAAPEEEEADELPSFEEPAFDFADSDVSADARTVLDMEAEEPPLSAEPEADEWEPPKEERDEGGPAVGETPESELPSFDEEEAVYTPAGSGSGAPPPPPPAPPGDRRNRNILIAAVVILLLCCCCFLLASYFWLGDLLLQYTGQF